MTDKEKIAFLIETVNAVQRCLSGLVNNSSDFLRPVKDAWNTNASALSTLSDEQTEYLNARGSCDEKV